MVVAAAAAAAASVKVKQDIAKQDIVKQEDVNADLGPLELFGLIWFSANRVRIF